MLRQIGDKSGQIASGHDQLLDESKQFGDLPVQNRRRDLLKKIILDNASQSKHLIAINLTGNSGACLIKQTDGIAECAVCQARDRLKRIRRYVDAIGKRNLGQALGHAFHRDAAKIITLAAGEDGCRNAVRLSCGKDENRMGRRFFECFQKGIESAGRKHMDFINNIDLEARLGRHENDFIADAADVVDTVV